MLCCILCAAKIQRKDETAKKNSGKVKGGEYLTHLLRQNQAAHGLQGDAGLAVLADLQGFHD